MEKINCNFCNSDRYKFVTKQTDIIYKTTKEYFNIVECVNCGLNYVNPRPSEQEIKNYYKSDYQFHKSNGYLKSNIRRILKYLANSRFAIIANYLPIINEKLKFYIEKKITNPITLSKNDFLLDIGAGSINSSYIWGFKGSLKYYKTITKNIYAIEPIEQSLNNLKNENITSFRSINDISKELKFDFIRMNWSLEHTHDPKKYFEYFAKSLKKNGKIILSIPNYEGLLYLSDKSQVEIPIHLYHFKKSDIINYCKLFDLEIINFETFSIASMFYSVSFYNEKFNQFRNMNLLQLRKFQFALNLFDKFKLGNDMVFTLRKLQKNIGTSN